MAKIKKPKQSHESCGVYVDLIPRTKSGELITTHAAALRCCEHNAWLRWLSLSQLSLLQGQVEFRE